MRQRLYVLQEHKHRSMQAQEVKYITSMTYFKLGIVKKVRPIDLDREEVKFITRCGTKIWGLNRIVVVRQFNFSFSFLFSQVSYSWGLSIYCSLFFYIFQFELILIDLIDIILFQVQYRFSRKNRRSDENQTKSNKSSSLTRVYQHDKICEESDNIRVLTPNYKIEREFRLQKLDRNNSGSSPAIMVDNFVKNTSSTQVNKQSRPRSHSGSWNIVDL